MGLTNEATMNDQNPQPAADAQDTPTPAGAPLPKPPLFNPRENVHPSRIADSMTAYAQRTTGDVQALAYCCASLARQIERLQSDVRMASSRSRRGL